MKAAKKYPHILSALYETPWAITETWLATICGIVEKRSEMSIAEFKAAMKNQDEEDEDGSKLDWSGRVAIIPVTGPIFPKSNLMTALSGATSSAEVSDMIDEATDKNAIGAIFRFDSPGGAVSGGFEVANKIAEMEIPTYAVVEGAAASLAYLWASQCDAICISQASVVGSVSVVMRMSSSDRAMKNEGVDIVTIKSGTLKQAGDPSNLAFANQYASLLSQLDTYHQMFTSMVGTARPKMDMSKVETGDVWIGSKAVAAGLADRIGTMRDVLNDFE